MEGGSGFLPFPVIALPEFSREQCITGTSDCDRMCPPEGPALKVRIPAPQDLSDRGLLTSPLHLSSLHPLSSPRVFCGREPLASPSTLLPLVRYSRLMSRKDSASQGFLLQSHSIFFKEILLRTKAEPPGHGLCCECLIITFWWNPGYFDDCFQVIVMYMLGR